MRSSPRLAIDHASSRNRSALALPSQREILQAPGIVTAPGYVSYPAEAVSGSREPSRLRKSRVVSAGRRRSRLPPPRRRDSNQQQRAHQVTRTPPCAGLHSLTRIDAVSLFVALPMAGHEQEQPTLANLTQPISRRQRDRLRHLTCCPSWAWPAGVLSKARFWQRGARRQSRTGAPAPLRRGPSAF